MRFSGKQLVVLMLAVLVASLTGAYAMRVVVANGQPGDMSADAGFARDMSTHHQQAIEMSFIIRENSQDSEVRQMAYDVINTQANQRGMMLGWLEQWGLPQASTAQPMAWMKNMDGMPMSGSQPKNTKSGIMPGMATPAQIDSLKGLQGKEADIEYLKLMIAHHTGGIAMAKGALIYAGQPVVRQLAQKIIDGQQSEIEAMQTMLKARTSP